MTDLTYVKGLIIKSEPFGEYDRRIVILTVDRGKISAFAQGARRTNNKLAAGTNLFCFGEFGLYSNRNSYSLKETKIDNYFSYFRDDFVAAYYGMYLVEIADYYCRENLADKEMLTLLYQALKALTSEKFDNNLVKAVFEIKAVMIEGEFAGPSDKKTYSNDVLYTLDYIRKTPSLKVFSFAVSSEVLGELIQVGKEAIKRHIDSNLKSAQILETLI